MIVQPAVFVSLAVLLTGCASTGGYFVDRGRDATDIVTLCVGVGAGAKAQLGPLHTGLIADVDLAGLRGGRLFVFHRDNHLGLPNSIDLEAVLYGTSWFYHDLHSYAEDQRRKYFSSTPFDPNWPLPIFRLSDANPGGSASYYTQVEAVVALGPSIRLGFNPGELLDFILGWTTLDIFNDDLERKKRKSNKTIESDLK